MCLYEWCVAAVTIVTVRVSLLGEPWGCMFTVHSLAASSFQAEASMPYAWQHWVSLPSRRGHSWFWWWWLLMVMKYVIHWLLLLLHKIYISILYHIVMQPDIVSACQRIHFKLGCVMYKSLSRQAPQYPADDVQLVADSGWRRLRSARDRPASFHELITVSATEASLLLDPEYGMLYLQNSDMTSALDSLGANWSRICLFRALNHGALWHTVFLRIRNILTYLLSMVH